MLARSKFRPRRMPLLSGQLNRSPQTMIIHRKPALTSATVSPALSSLSARTPPSHPGNLGLAFGSNAVQTNDSAVSRRADFREAGAVDRIDACGRRSRQPHRERIGSRPSTCPAQRGTHCGGLPPAQVRRNARKFAADASRNGRPSAAGRDANSRQQRALRLTYGPVFLDARPTTLTTTQGST